MSALALLLATGCGAGASSPASAKLGDEVRLLDAGGSGRQATSPFAATGREIRVEYRLTRMPSDRKVVLALEKSDGTGGFFRTVDRTDSVSDDLTGSLTMAVIPGTYRLRVETNVAWSARIFQSRL